MIPNPKILLAQLISGLLLLTGFIAHALAAEKPELVVAISIDMPPYVTNNASGGLEVDIARAALKGYDLRFVQHPYGELQTAVQQGWADVSLGVEEDSRDVATSKDFITFVNYAISRKADDFRIDKVADLRDHRVLTWGNAYLELGAEFEALFSPQSPQRRNYIEVADQKEQVRRFWEERGLVIVVDRSIFTYFSKKMGHDLNEVSFHAIFPPVTNFKAGFRDASLRDRFDEELASLCRSGAYDELLRRYGVELKHSVCE